ncbi:HNH endonuclease [Rhizobium etli]|uniref:HNH endonuclease n=1 Tax=Rhizobium etli TaxID=29449 RepID=UPI000383A446|nr:HNH endonuclease [Rhizobium etli]AGS25643.1 HNH endonuclease protein [Rhizobium etli bv. mimosae str. Mim1]
MIRVDRIGKVPARLDLSDKASLASLERQKIIDGLVGGRPADDTTFSAYADDSVRGALQDLFHNKCAYCESKIAGSQDTDIEHYRPKGRVTDAIKSGINHPGYWWLAMDWTNLVLACMHCNQRRRQLIYTPGMTEEQIVALIESKKTVTVGKLDAFPTADSKWVTDYKLDVATEQPLLIDPTRVDPELHLDWVVDENLSTVRARDSSQIGQTSIDIFALNRRRLTEDRMSKLLLLQWTGNRALEELNAAVNEADDAIAALREKTALDYLEILRLHCAPDQPYAGMARAYLAHLATKIAAIRAV